MNPAQLGEEFATDSPAGARKIRKGSLQSERDGAKDRSFWEILIGTQSGRLVQKARIPKRKNCFFPLFSSITSR